MFRIQGDCVLHGGICDDVEGWSYLGEYFRNPERGPVRIWRMSPDHNLHEVAHEFAAGSIRHVHGIYRDPFEDSALWVTVGDYAGECYILRTRDRFNSLERFGDGGQIYRAVKLFFTQEHVCWLTDSNLEQNYACRMDRAKSRLEMGQTIPNSTWYGATTADGLQIAFTTVEPGPAKQRDEAAVLVSDDGFTWHEVGAFRKDIWRPQRVFKFGVIACPSGTYSSDSVYLSGEGLRGLDGKTVMRPDHQGTCGNMIRTMARPLVALAAAWFDDAVPTEKLHRYLVSNVELLTTKILDGDDSRSFQAIHDDVRCGTLANGGGRPDPGERSRY